MRISSKSVSAAPAPVAHHRRFSRKIIRSTRKHAALALAVAATCAAPVTALVASGQWTFNGGGNWSATGNGNGGTVPNATDDTADLASIDLTADANVVLDIPVTLGQLTFGDTDTSTAAGWTISGANALTLSTSGAPPTITVNALGTGKVATISAAVAGTQGLTKAGAGTLVLTGANSYSGGTTVSAGTLQIGTGGTAGTLGSGAIVDNGTLNINHSDAVTISDNISGSGAFGKQGGGVLTLSGTNTYGGVTNVDGGLINFFTAATYSGPAANNINVNPPRAGQNGGGRGTHATFPRRVNNAATRGPAVTPHGP